MKIRALVGALICFLFLSAQSHSASLDWFLAGLDQNCTGTKAFEAFGESLFKRYVHPKDSEQSIEIPENLKPFMEPLTIKYQPNPGGWFRVIVPLRGEFRGLDVTGIEFLFGDENGIHSSAINFANSLEQVNKVLGKGIEAANKKAQEEYRKLAEAELAGAEPESLSINLVEGHAALTCDMST